MGRMEVSLKILGSVLVPFFKETCALRLYSLFLKQIGIHTMQGWTATTKHGVTRKRSTKKIQHAENLFTKNLQLKDVNSRLKATKIIGQRKAFYRQRIPESSCARKQTADIDILLTSRNGERKIMESIRITRTRSRKRGGTS